MAATLIAAVNPTLYKAEVGEERVVVRISEADAGGSLFDAMQAAAEAGADALCDDDCIVVVTTVVGGREPVRSECAWDVVVTADGWAATVLEDGGAGCLLD